MHPSELLAALSSVLAERGIGWYLFGAHAVLVWGRPRFTFDIDVTARLDPEQIVDFNADMVEAGFRLRAPDADFLARTRVLPYAHPATGLMLDVVLASPGLEEEFIRRAVRVDIGGASIPVISPEDLVITKILAGRPKDLEDAWSVLERQRERIDLERIRSILATLEGALAQTDLLPAFEAQLARVDRPGRRRIRGG